MKIFDKTYQVKKFSFFSSEDPYSFEFCHEICWSRIYEYPFILRELETIGRTDLSIHNCSWGFRDIHLVFKTWLDILYRKVFHSDLKPSTLYNTSVWDITTFPPESLHDAFDAVINVSTIEEVPHDHIEVMKNHLVQLRKGGRFICTFDYPGIQLEKIEHFLEEKIVIPPSRLTPRNSRLEDKVINLPHDFNVGYLVIERTK